MMLSRNVNVTVDIAASRVGAANEIVNLLRSYKKFTFSSSELLIIFSAIFSLSRNLQRSCNRDG